MPNRYIPRKISQISKTDSRVIILGKVIAIAENSVIIDDDSGKIEIFTDEPVEKDKLIRVFCSIVNEQLKADVIQSLNGFDVNLYNKALELYNKVGV